MSARKETSVFIDSKGLEWLSENYYQHYAGEPAVGEAFAGTLGDQAVARQVHQALPEVQLIFILRQPVDRLYSHFSFLQSVQAMDPPHLLFYIHSVPERVARRTLKPWVLL